MSCPQDTFFLGQIQHGKYKESPADQTILDDELATRNPAEIEMYHRTSGQRIYGCHLHDQAPYGWQDVDDDGYSSEEEEFHDLPQVLAGVHPGYPNPEPELDDMENVLYYHEDEYQEQYQNYQDGLMQPWQDPAYPMLKGDEYFEHIDAAQPDEKNDQDVLPVFQNDKELSDNEEYAEQVPQMGWIPPNFSTLL